MKSLREIFLIALIVFSGTSSFAAGQDQILKDVEAVLAAHREQQLQQALEEHRKRKEGKVYGAVVQTTSPPTSTQPAGAGGGSEKKQFSPVSPQSSGGADGVDETFSASVQEEEMPMYEILADAGIQADPDEGTKEWGSFPEASVWTGGWMNPTADTWGVWGDPKYLQWFTKYEEPENFGLGGRVKMDYGENDSGYDWGYIAPGPTFGYYRGLDLSNDFEMDISFLYRIDKRRDDGLMPTLHAEFNHILDYKNRLTFQVDGSYFPGDSWLGPGIYWHHKIDQNWKVVTGAGLSLSWLDGDFFSGFMPSVRVKYKNRYSIGFNANLFTGLGTFYGIILAYELTPDIHSWWQEKNAAGVRFDNPKSDEKISEFSEQDLNLDQQGDQGIPPEFSEGKIQSPASNQKSVPEVKYSGKTIEQQAQEKAQGEKL